MPKRIAASVIIRRSQTKIFGMNVPKAVTHRTVADPIIAAAAVMPAGLKRAAMAVVRTVTRAAIRTLLANTIMRERLTDVPEHTLAPDLQRDTGMPATALEVARMLTAAQPTARARAQVIVSEAAV